MSCSWVSCLARDGHAIQIQKTLGGTYAYAREELKCWSNWTELAVSCVCVICFDKVYCKLSDWWTSIWWLSCCLVWLSRRINNASDYLAVGADRGSIGCSFNWFGGRRAGLRAPAERFWSSKCCLVYKTAFTSHRAVSRHISDIFGIWWLSNCYPSHVKSIMWSKLSIPPARPICRHIQHT